MDITNNNNPSAVNFDEMQKSSDPLIASLGSIMTQLAAQNRSFIVLVDSKPVGNSHARNTGALAVNFVNNMTTGFLKMYSDAAPAIAESIRGVAAERLLTLMQGPHRAMVLRTLMDEVLTGASL